MPMQTLKSINEKLIRRLTVNYIAYMGQKEVSPEWLEGYYQAKQDSENFLKQLKVFEADD